MGGQIQVGITGLPAVQAYAKSGKLKIIALTTANRFASAPDYATVAEQGFPGYAAPPWSGFFVPKGTPKPLVEKISSDMREVMSDPKAKEKMIAAGSEFTPSTPEQFQSFVQKEIAKWAEAVKISGARID
ncbi:Tripartite tricarboxylate transporter family receptor [compost metagenome]